MREIKFRAWDSGHSTMIFFDMWGTAIAPKSDTAISVYEKRWRTSKNVTVMQFTGLKDKNGKEIYDGDVVYDAIGKFRGSIEWGRQANQAAWILNDRDTISWLNLWANRSLLERIDLEVIGNIYENPELLKSTAI